MPKPQYTYRRIRKQDSIRDQSTHHRHNYTQQSAAAWKNLERILNNTHLDERRLRDIRVLINKIEQGIPISKEGKQHKLIVEALEKIYDLAKWREDLSQLDRNIKQHTQAILSVPRSDLHRTDLLHVPSFITACLTLVILVEALMAKKQR